MNSVFINLNILNDLFRDRTFKIDDRIIEITSFKGYDKSYGDQLTWISKVDLDKLQKIDGGIFIVPDNIKDNIINTNINLIYSSNPRLLFAQVLSLIKKVHNKENTNGSPRIEQRIGINTFIHETVKLGKNVIIGHNTTVLENTEIGDNVIIGNNCCIGGEGFGYVFDDSKNEYLHLTHFGGVKIGDNVEIGNNVCIDRATFGVTEIASGVKIDNQTQIAHNSYVGSNTLIMANVVLSGSTRVGSNCWISPSVTVLNKISIGNNTKVGLASVVTKNLESDSFYLGYPIKKIN